ncbi:FecCD family ABC transporter permease [Isoptericola aurantiacus]|uniref:FecCD family ABC transporter permease n=1 Tax=Isoptericola aurantiacus TaxID=3377839 RepID=UPI00383AA1C0
MLSTATRTPPPAVRRRWVVAGAVVLLLVLVVASVALGSRSIAPGTVLDAVLHPDPTDDEHRTVQILRIPRTVLILVVGAALGAAGTVMQAMTRNPLAEPGLLGINAGAAAGVVTGAVLTGALTDWSFLFALAGAAVAAVAVHTLGGASGGGGNPVRLVLAGVALTAVLGAYTSALLVSYPRIFERFRFWDAGSFQGPAADVLAPTVALVGVGLVLALGLTRSLNALALGGDLGRALGVHPRRAWLAAGAAVVLLAGTATAAAGPIAFVGLVAPLTARAIVGPDYRRILPLGIVLAMAVLLAADVVGRLVVLPSELEASIVCALLGAPVFVGIVRRRRVPRL